MSEIFEESWFSEQVKQRKLRDDEVFTDALIGLTGAVMGNKIATALKDNRQIMKGALDEVLKFYHLKASEIPDEIEDPEEQMEYAFRPYGIMKRTVQLEKGWHKNAAGPMLGVMKEEGILVALLPNRHILGYSYKDPSSGWKINIDSRIEELFETEAICFYKPFPLKKLNLFDIIRYMVETLSFSDIAAVAGTTAIAVMVGMIFPRMNRLLYSSVIKSGNISVLLAAGSFLVALTVSNILLNSIKSLFLAKPSTKLSVSVEAAAMMRVLSLPADFFRNYTSGELAQRIQYMNNLCQTLLDITLSTGLTSIFSLAYVSQILTFTPALVVPALFVIIITTVFTLVTTLLEMNLSKKRMELSAKESGITHSMVAGVQKIKLSGAEKRAFSKWANLFSKSAKLEYNPILFLKVNGVIQQAISLIGMAVIYYVAIVEQISVADYVAFNTAYGMVSGAFLSLSGIANSIASIKPILEMVSPFFNTVPEISENKRMVNRLGGSIELNHVSFRYSENAPMILDNISIRIRPKQYIAIVGKTGCGKSTLMRLLLGFEKPMKGSIFYDGMDMNSLDLKSLRKNIGSVMQNGKLFLGSIYENIVVAAPQLTMDEAWEAAEQAGIAGDIENMPMGMQTLISEGAGGISGGQKQRILIARAIAAKPKILIFDEATSALDNLTQKKVSQALDNLKCTRIVIAHRLSTIKQCDRILVLDSGKIIEDGSFDELMEKKGFFADLVERQRA
ncbi:MAG: ATP-binding cassette domain-containing protein [Lachnospiraceae bacterium]|nr:ATP-binding cassette domain-containing protein [Lachnospiraceae bacterium]